MLRLATMPAVEGPEEMKRDRMPGQCLYLLLSMKNVTKFSHQICDTLASILIYDGLHT